MTRHLGSAPAPPYRVAAGFSAGGDPTMGALTQAAVALRKGDLSGVDELGDNHTRAVRALQSLVAYGGGARAVRHEEFSTVLGDLLSDMRHLCDLAGEDFDELAAQRHHYDAEIRGEL